MFSKIMRYQVCLGVWIFILAGRIFADNAVDPAAFDKWSRHKVADTKVSMECWGDFEGPKNAIVLYNLLDKSVSDSLVIKKFYDLSGMVGNSGFPVRVFYAKSKGPIDIEKMRALVPIREGEKLTSQKIVVSGIEGYIDNITSENSAVRALYLARGDQFWWIESEHFTDPTINKIIERLFESVQVTE